MKIKLFTGKKKCNSGETYTFKNGRAEVPGVCSSKGPIFITIQEFIELNNQEEEKDLEKSECI